MQISQSMEEETFDVVMSESPADTLVRLKTHMSYTCVSV